MFEADNSTERDAIQARWGKDVAAITDATVADLRGWSAVEKTTTPSNSNQMWTAIKKDTKTELTITRRKDRNPIFVLYEKVGNKKESRCQIKEQVLGTDTACMDKAFKVLSDIGTQYSEGKVEHSGLYDLRDSMLGDAISGGNKRKEKEISKKAKAPSKKKAKSTAKNPEMKPASLLDEEVLPQDLDSVLAEHFE